MKKKIYYVVEKELQSVGEVEETTGHKTIYLYKINEEGDSVIQFDANSGNPYHTCLLEENTEEVIENLLSENGVENFELIQL